MTCTLSICMMGRNDNYCGDFLYRMETALNFTAKNVFALNLQDSVEVIITDWNSEVRLSDALNLIPEAWQICRFVYVPPQIAAPQNPPKSAFNSALAANVAFRRASGKYIMFTPADVFFPVMSLKNLIEILKGNFPVSFDVETAYMLIRRKYIPWQLLDKKPDMAVLEDFLLKNTHLLWDGQFYPGLNGNMGAMLMHRKFYEASRGFDERLKGWGWWDIELGLRMNLSHRCVELSYFGIYSYDMDQNPALRGKDINANANPHNVVNMTIEVNDANWGLADNPLEFYACPPKAIRQSERNLSPAATLTRNALCQYLADKNVINQILKIFGDDLRSVQEFPALYLLAYYSAMVKPSAYLEFGFGKSVSANIVAVCYPCVEIFGVNDLQPEHFYQYPHNISTNLKNKFNYMGNLRYVPGDMNTALERLEAVEGRICPELIFFRADLFQTSSPLRFGEGPGVRLQSLISRMPKGGALILSSANPALFKAIDNFFIRYYPGYIYLRSEKFNTAIFINSQDFSLMLPEMGAFGEHFLNALWAV